MDNDDLDLFDDADSSDIESVDGMDIGSTFSVIGSDKKPLKARQKLEVYWEQKRLVENLQDVLTDNSSFDTRTTLPTKRLSLHAVGNRAAVKYELRP